MKLQDLKRNPGAKKSRTRVGRGIAAGKGKTAGRGTKGQGARAGGGTRPYHQGGNLPFYRRLPFKRGFTRWNRIEYNEVNVGRLAEKFTAGSEVTPEAMAEAGLLHNDRLPVAILGDGELGIALTVKAHRFTRTAREKIEAAGGKVEVLDL